jgi:esterase/lipase
VRRLVLISAAVIYVSPRHFTRELMSMIRDRNFSHFVKARNTPANALLEFAKCARRLRPEIARLKVPTLIVQGDRDPIVHPLSARWIYSRIDAPKELVMVPGVRHLVLLERQAATVIEAVRRFLNGS